MSQIPEITQESPINAGFVENQKSEPRKLEIWEHITGDDVRANKDKIFLFGDNLTGKGYGGQAKEMRGEENAVGIPTKKAPTNNPSAFFTDKEFAVNAKAIDKAFNRIPPDKTIVIPKAGLGTGLAQLQAKAPNTFAYLNEKLAEIGFNNLNKETERNIATNSLGEKKVVVQSRMENLPTAKRLLDLNNIQTASLRLLSPTEKEIEALKIDSQLALAEYADRLRADYKTDKNSFRDGLKLLSDSLDKGEQITVACSCRNGGMCHADVVKMAIEKVNTHIKNGQIQETIKNDRSENHSNFQDNSKTNSKNQEQKLNQRTQRAINEILAVSENDLILEKINQTDGRNRSEQASYLGKSSQFIRDIYERGGTVVDGKLIIPQEKLTISEPLAITTESYAVKRIRGILQDESKAKELAPVVVEYGNKIAGAVTDGETKLKVFSWIYDSLEGKSDFPARGENNSFGEKPKFEETLEKIGILAEEMHHLEPLDKIEFVLLAGVEQSEQYETVLDNKGENLNLEEIYEEAISFDENEKQAEHLIPQQGETAQPNGKTNTEGYERIELSNGVPRIPEDYTQTEITHLISETLPEIDRKLENGVTPKEILAPYTQMVWQSAKDDAQYRLESIHRKQENKSNEAKQSSGKTLDSSQTLAQQLAKIDLRRQNVIELKSPTEYQFSEKEAVNTFYRRQKIEVGNLLIRIDEIRERQPISGDKTEETALKKELNQIKEAKPNFAFKLENSSEIVVGKPSEQSVQTRNFISSYVNYQLKQPETRLRFENQRYRLYSAKLESATTRDEVMKSASEIRAENAALGLKWKDLGKVEKEKLPLPLSQKEMQFLFTETSPAHYTSEMTAVRLSYAHAGASRRSMTESLVKGDIQPSPEAQKLIESLELRLQRREIKDSLAATKHFFESVKTPNELLKYKNNFDHREVYQKLPPQEKDFVYFKATQQKENLEYQLLFKKQQLNKDAEISQSDIQKPEASKTEKSFYLNSQFNQARILGAKVESAALTQKEISERDFATIGVLLNNQPIEKLENIAQELKKNQNPENKKIGEILQTFAHAEISKAENKTIVSIKLPENALVGVENYRELLEKFYPDDQRENDKYKFSNFSEKEVSRALRLGQDEAIQNFRDEIKSNIYQKDASENIFQTETAVLEKIDKIKQFQTEARFALRENEKLTEKYAARANSKLQNQKIEALTSVNHKEIVSIALGAKSSNTPSNKVNDQFLQAVQKEITISDFNKFTANDKLLDEIKVSIRMEFAEISQGLNVLDESKLKTPKTFESREIENTITDKVTAQEFSENKPMTLRLFEKELERAERQLFAASLSEKLSGNDLLENEKNLDPTTVFSTEERDQIKSKAFEVTKERLEPKELDADNRKMSPEASRQAFATYKQLERASNLFQTSDDKSKITEAFFKLDREAAALNQIRQDYNRSEKMALLRDGIKTDLVDWLKKNTDTKQNSMGGQISKILIQNLKQSDFAKFADDRGQVSVLSRQIAEKIETKQISAIKDKGTVADSREIINQAKTPYSFNGERDKTSSLITEKTKNAPVLTR